MSRRVYPVEGFYLRDVPHVEHDCDDDLCVDSGAFTTKKPPPEKAADKSETPASAGVLDSKEP
jgi:hypothetical protein